MLVEREEELQTLLKAIETARAGHGQIALISGEAGIGKSTLLSAFRVSTLSSYPELRWCSGNCEALFTPRTLGPVHDMGEALGDDVIKALHSDTGQTGLYAAILHALETHEASILIFEDLHWADYATLDLLKFLSRRIGTLPVMLILTFRDDEVGLEHPLTQLLGDLPGHCTRRLPLQTLSANAVCKLAESRGHSGKQLFTITNGNPFYVTEMLASNTPSGFVPASVKDAVALRLAQLAPQDRELLERISVLPRAPSHHFLEALLGEAQLDLVSNCVNSGFLVEDGLTVRFRHELTRLATFDRISPAKRRAYHAECLKTLMKRGDRIPLDQIVHHAAGALDSEKVLEFAPKAARAAAAAGSHHEAAAHYATALKYVNEAEPELAAELYESWAYESALADHFEDEVLDARRHAITLWRAINRPDKVGHNLQQLSRLHWYRAESGEATRYADQAIRVLEAIPASSERAMAYSVRSQLHMLNDKMDEAVQWAETALSIEAENPDMEVRMHALNNLGTAKVFRNNPDGLQHLKESLALALTHGHHEHAARAYNNMGEYAVEFRNFDLAERILQEGLAFDTEHDLDAWTRYLSGRLAQLRLDQGRLNDAITIAEGIVSLEEHSLLSCLPAQQVLATARMRRGDADAETLLKKALADAIATDDLQHIVPARLALIEWACMSDFPDQAAEHMSRLLELSSNDRHPWNIGMRSVWADRLGLKPPQDRINDLPEPFILELNGDYLDAAQKWEALGLPFETAFNLMRARQQDSFQKAIGLLEAMKAQPALKKLHTMADQAGVKLESASQKRGPYKAARSHPLGLTAKEQSVLKLICEGLANKDIADKLSRSQRTIEHHVSSVLGKLSAPNRMAAILRVQSEPWLIEEPDGKQ